MEQNNTQKPRNLYPAVLETNPELNSPFLAENPKTQLPSPSLYPSIDPQDLAQKLYPDIDDENHHQISPDNPNHPTPSAPPHDSREEILLTVPLTIVHLVDKEQSVELASGDLSVVQLIQSGHVVAVFVRIGDEIQWPLAKDEAAVKIDDCHYFFVLRLPKDEETESKDGEDVLNYGVTFGDGKFAKEFDGILEKFGCFSVQKVKGDVKIPGSKAVEGEAAAAAAYWTTLAPNVEDYGHCLARGIAMGSGQIIRGIVWCGDVTVDRLKWGNEFLKKRMEPSAKPAEISKETMKRMKRAKNMTKTSEKVMTGILSGVLKVSGFFTSSVVNSKAGQKFFSLLPGEVVLASLDGFGKVCDAFEVVGKNVMSTSSTVTTGLVSQRYGEQAAEATNEGLHAAGHAIGTAWAVFKIRKAFNPKSAFKPSTIAKSAAKAVAAAEKAGKQNKGS